MVRWFGICIKIEQIQNLTSDCNTIRLPVANNAYTIRHYVGFAERTLCAGTDRISGSVKTRNVYLPLQVTNPEAVFCICGTFSVTSTACAPSLSRPSLSGGKRLACSHLRVPLVSAPHTDTFATQCGLDILNPTAKDDL